MPKDALHIKAFEGGINKKNDPRDIKDNELVEVFNADVSEIGRIVMPGDGKSAFITVNSKEVVVSPTNFQNDQQRFHNETPLSQGYGLFSFTHDYNFDNQIPEEINTEFICINDGADIDVWTDNKSTNNSYWKESLISLGRVHNTGIDGTLSGDIEINAVKPIYYKAGNGLRVCDANFSELKLETLTNAAIESDATVTFALVSNTEIQANDYIKIDSEVMKVVSKDSNNNITVQRARFGTTSANHITASEIYLLNVPKIFTHIKRSMLEKASANVTLNTWLQDIQVPEAPLYGALTVFRSNIIGIDAGALTANSLYPDGPEKVNLGISFSTVEDNAMLALHTEEVISSESTSLETTLLITLADSDDPTTPVDVTSSTYNFSVGKFIVISGATGDGVNLNGIFEIAGFGGTGEVKIVADADAVGYECTGKEQVILEDEIIDDNLKKRYILGMSYLYSGGGGVMQESNVTTGLAYASSLLGADKTIPAISGWRTAVGATGGGDMTLTVTVGSGGGSGSSTNVTCADTSDLREGWSVTGTNIGTDAKVVSITNDTTFVVSVANSGTVSGTLTFTTNQALTTSNINGYTFKGHGNIHATATSQYLFYENSAVTVVAGTYYVTGAIKFTKCTGVSVKIYVGIGPDQTSVSGYTALTISQPANNTTNDADPAEAAGSGLVEFAGEVTAGSNPDANVPVAMQVIAAANGNGEKVRIISIDVRKKDVAPEIMSNTNAIDLRDVQDVAKGYLTFLCNNSRTGAYNETTQNNSWNERIEGFRIYLKEVDIIGGGTAEEWAMLYDVDLRNGTYIMHAKDSDVENLRKGDIASNVWHATNTPDVEAIVTGNLKGDSIKIPPLLTYESENGYKADTNLAAMYKATASVERKVFIGNIKIGESTFPDRMLKADIDKFDTFPDDGTHFIDVATSDGEGIVALESIGNKLIQFKERTVYLIKVSSEGEELEAKWSGAGIKNPSQIAKASEGVFWVNSNGMYYYDGKKLTNISSSKFGTNNWIVNENDKQPIILGYDESSNKIIIITSNVSGKSNGGYIYDINNSSLVEHQNLFNWYSASNPTDIVVGNSESEI